MQTSVIYFNINNTNSINRYTIILHLYFHYFQTFFNNNIESTIKLLTYNGDRIFSFTLFDMIPCMYCFLSEANSYSQTMYLTRFLYKPTYLMCTCIFQDMYLLCLTCSFTINYMFHTENQIFSCLTHIKGNPTIRPGTIHLTHDSIRFDYYTCNSIRFHTIRFDYIFLNF